MIHFWQDKEVAKFVSQLAEEVHNRMRKINVKGKTITLKLKVRSKDAPRETAKFLGLSSFILYLFTIVIVVVIGMGKPWDGSFSIFTKFNIAISVVNMPFLLLNRTMAISLSREKGHKSIKGKGS